MNMGIMGDARTMQIGQIAKEAMRDQIYKMGVRITKLETDNDEQRMEMLTLQEQIDTLQEQVCQLLA